MARDFLTKVNFPATSTTAASINVPHGTAPTSPVNGDVWTTSSGVYAQINGSTVGPLGTGGGSTPAIPTFTVRVATTAALGGTYSNGTAGVGATLTIASTSALDGLALANGDRILVKDQATSFQNGIYTRTSATVLTRATDADTNTEIGESVVFVNEGSTWAGYYFQTSFKSADTIGTTGMPWYQIIDTRGGTFTGRIIASPSTSTRAGLNLGSGSAPSSPTNGDVWTTTTGLYAQINGGTVGPMGANAFGQFTIPQAVNVTASSPNTAVTLNFGSGTTITSDNSAKSITIGTSMPSNQMGFRTGGYWYGAQSFGSGGTQTTSTITLNTLYLVPLIVYQAVSIDRLNMEVTTAVASAVIRGGIYSSDSTGTPTTLVNDYGTLAAATIGEKPWTISETLTAGIYWLGIVNQTAGNLTVRCITGQTWFQTNATTSFASFGASFYTMTGVTGALPTTLTLTSSSSTVYPKVMVRTV